MSIKVNPVVKKIISVAGTTALLWVLFEKTDKGEIHRQLSEFNLVEVFFTFGLYALSQVVSALRMKVMFDGSVQLSAVKSVIIYFKSMFMSTFVPVGVGAEIYKSYYFHKMHHMDLKKAVKASIAERISGLSALTFILILAYSIYLISTDQISPSLTVFAPVVLLSVLYIAVNLFSHVFSVLLVKATRLFLLSFCVQALQVISFLFLISNTNAEIPLSLAASVFFLTSLASFVPLSFSGLGAREAVVLFLAGTYIFSPEPVVATTLVIGTYQVILSLCSGAFFLKKDRNSGRKNCSQALQNASL